MGLSGHALVYWFSSYVRARSRTSAPACKAKSPRLQSRNFVLHGCPSCTALPGRAAQLTKHPRKFWTIAKTFTASSAEVLKSLTSASLTYYHPKFRETRNSQGVRRVRSLFPNYVFVQVTSANWCSLSKVRGVEHLFFTPSIVVVDDEFIAWLESHEDELGYIVPERIVFYDDIELFAGQRVRGVYGLFEHQFGKFLGMGAGEIARVAFNILGEECEAEVNVHELVAA